MAGKPLYPALVTGTGSSRLFPPRFSRYRVTFGAAISTEGLPTDDLRRAAHELTKRWSTAIAALATER